MSHVEYRDLLYLISRQLVSELPRVIYSCTDFIAPDSAGNIRDVLTLFAELEKRNNLGIDRLDNLKDILRALKKKSLLNRVEKFEIRRKAQSVGVISSLRRAAGALIGAVRLVCNFRTLAGGLVLVGSGLALRSCTSFEEYGDAFNKVVLPALTKLVELSEGSLCFTVQAETPFALNELWGIYKNGTLKHRLQEFLVTEEIKQLASGEDIEVTVYVDEQEYREAYLDLMLQQNHASDEKKTPPAHRRRKNSDSFLLLSPKEDVVTLMKLEQAENKWNFKMQVLEREIEKLKTEVAMAEDLQRRVNESGEKDLERPQLRRRRHSDTSLYCKPKEAEIAQGEDVQERFLGEEKYLFVQSYLENIHETYSITTSATDSGIVTHGAPSEIDISDDTSKLCLKHLRKKVTSELETRLAVDQDAKRRVYQAFGINHPSLFLKFENIFRLFPDTPVKLLIDVFDALQLYDLLELLEPADWGSTKQHTAKSLRIALTFDEIKKLRNFADRDTTYLSCAAVLIFVDDERNYFIARDIEAFFTDLNTKSDVTILRERDLSASEGDIGKIALTAIEKWIRRQDDFSFFAVFDFSNTLLSSLVTGCFRELVSRIPDKPKLGVFLYDAVMKCPETLLVTGRLNWYSKRLLLAILKKRWQTLDLISMMAEFKRSVKVNNGDFIQITDYLSSLPKFKRKEHLK